MHYLLNMKDFCWQCLFAGGQPLLILVVGHFVKHGSRKILQLIGNLHTCRMPGLLTVRGSQAKNMVTLGAKRTKFGHYESLLHIMS